MNHEEYNLQKNLCRYLDLKYPKILYMSDTIANLKLSIVQAVRNKAIQKDCFKCPDLLIFEPRNGFNGLFIEIKIKSPFKKNGEILKNEHLEGQYATIQRLNELGYMAWFGVGFDECVKIIEKYMSNN